MSEQKVTQFKDIPEEWRKDPNVFHFLNQHTEWLGNDTTQHVCGVLKDEIQRATASLLTFATSPSIDDSLVRAQAAYVAGLIAAEKVIYATDRFIEHARKSTGSR